MAPTLAELAEDTAVYARAQPSFEHLDRDGFVYISGPQKASVQRVRLDAVEATVEWSRAETRRRGQTTITWWLGWSATPAGARDRLLELGLVPDEVPTLTGMTCTSPPPAVPGVDVRPVNTFDELLVALDVDWEVWKVDDAERIEQRAVEEARWSPPGADNAVRHYTAFVDGKPVGFARGIDVDQGVALFGGAVLPEARGRGVYRALVRARWEHAAARGTPLLVVQAGEMSAPVLAQLGFESHGEIQLLVDRL
jgi:GNAT superfamily N-acetyltransferase